MQLFISKLGYYYMCAGNGKSHYIKKQLAKCSDQLTISISEAFSPLGAITMLRFLPLYKGKIGLFFNFTLLPPDVSAGTFMHLTPTPIYMYPILCISRTWKRIRWITIVGLWKLLDGFSLTFYCWDMLKILTLVSPSVSLGDWSGQSI